MQDEAVASFRLSPQQEQLWVTQPEGPVGRSQAVVVIAGSVEPDRVREALATTVRRHEILRTTFQRQAGIRHPFQVVHDELPQRWEVVDLSCEPAGAQDDRLEQLSAEQLRAPIDLEQGPVLLALFATLAPDRHALVLTFPSVSADAGSLNTLVREVALLIAGESPAESPLQYADFAEWQQELLNSEDTEAAAARTFWQTLDATTAPAVPFLRRAANANPTARVRVPLTPETVAAVEASAERYDVGTDAFVLAAWQVLLGRLGATDDPLVAVILSGRLHAELETAIGAFARPVPMRPSLSDEPTFAEVVDRVSRRAADAAGLQSYLPAENGSPAIGFTAIGPLEPTTTNGLTFALRDLVGPADGQTLSLTWAHVDGSPRATISYDPEAIDDDSAERVARQLGRLLAGASESPDTRISELELLDEQDRTQLIYGFNESRADVPATTVDALVRAATAANPEGTAVVDDRGSISYAELDRRVNQLAHRLRRSGVGPDVVVGLCTDRSIDMVVGLLGILRAGGAYLPLHFEHPAARLGHQLAETGAPVLLTQVPLLGRLPGFDGEVIQLDRASEELDGEPATPPDQAGDADDLVYVIYTSGSTGTPKGVGVTNGNLVNYVTGVSERLGANGEKLAFGMVTAISTDLGNTAVFPALCSGGTLSLVGPAIAADPGALATRLREHPIDVLKITPSHLNALLVGVDGSAVLPRRTLVVGGEACSWDLVARVRELSDCRILNHYGPTETTVGSCTFAVDDGPGPYGPVTVPLGRPLANTACYVLDQHGAPSPLGVPGNLHIAGAGVARGYVGQPEQTEERFVADPFAAVPGGRMYSTGDLARWLPDGTLEFLGRADEQVKIRGFRVEPAEIEAALLRFDPVREAAVVARKETTGEVRLVGYVAIDRPVDTDDLSRHAAEFVPEFMVPSAFVVLDELPRTPSGKVDRLALPEPDVAASARRGEFVAPRTPIEEQVAAIWADVLGLDRVSVQDDFFALGGHSLLATQIVAQIRSDFSIELPLHSLFTSPTVEALSQTVFEMMGGGGDEETAALLTQLEGLSDEEAERLLAGELSEEEERSR
jgi:amino acid adenylation domain-containing protein